MSVVSADRPWLPRYRTIISAMLPEGFVQQHPAPYLEIARSLTGGKAIEQPGSITALNGLAVVRAVWNWIGTLTPFPPCTQGGEGAELVKQLVQGQFSDGHLLPTTADDHPESVWYFELQLSHALATAGLLLKSDALLAAAGRSANYILHEIQPDHATNRPWGLPAFLLSESTLPLVDWILHASTVHLTTTTDEMTLLLLADCLYCFAR